MSGLLLLLFLVVPVIELAVIIQAGQALGVLPVLVLLVAMSVAGAWLVKREGIGVWRRAQRQLQSGQVPGRELADAFLILLGGALMLTPGFVTDGLGLALLLPPVRAVVRPFLLARLQVVALGRATGGRGRGRPGVIDL